MSRLATYPLTRRWALALTLALVPGIAHAQPTTTQVSVGPGGVGGIFPSGNPAISADGRWVAFDSQAYNLVPGDTNGWSDVFVRDQQQGTTALVSVGVGGVQGNWHSGSPAISADGRWVVFRSSASNLVPGDTNGLPDVFVRDQLMGTTTRVNVGPGGAQANEFSRSHGISADGRWVVFASDASNLVANDTNRFTDIFLHDMQTATTTRISEGPGGVQLNGRSDNPAVSADGRWVVFDSSASNLVQGDTDWTWDVFIRDLQTVTTTRISVGPGGVQANGYSSKPSISPDGRWVAFESSASNLVAGDTNGWADVFVRDLQLGTTTRASLGAGGVQANGHSSNAAISADGRWVAFLSDASNLVPGDTNGPFWYGFDVFVRDLQAGATTRANVGPGGAEANDATRGSPGISTDGRWVAFDSSASNLVANDTNDLPDVFVHDRVDPACNVTLAPTSAVAPPAGATDTVHVTLPTGCAWSAVSNDPAWLTVTGGSTGTGSGTVTYGAAANPGAPRTGSLSIWGQRFPVHQASVTVPEAPAGLVASSIVGNRVTLRWAVPPAGPPPTGFVLEGGLYQGAVMASVPTGTSAPTFTFAAPSGSFWVRMHALSGPYRSAASNEILIYVNVPRMPSAPGNLLGLVNGSTLALTWTNTYEGGAPTSLELRVTGAIDAYFPLGITESFAFAGVPPGTYEFRVGAANAGGGPNWSNPVTLTFPGPCSGAPDPPASVVAYAVGRTVFVDWSPGTFGVAPTSYLLNVTGAFVGSFPTATRALSGTVGPGSYTLSVAAVNACGASATSVPQTVVVP